MHTRSVNLCPLRVPANLKANSDSSNRNSILAGLERAPAGPRGGRELRHQRRVDPVRHHPGDRGRQGPRKPLAWLYRDRADRQSRFGAAADALVARGLTAADAANIYKKDAAAISPALIPAP